MKINHAGSQGVKQASVEEQVPNKKNKGKVGRSGVRSITGPVKKESIFSEIKKSFSLILEGKKIKGYSVSAHKTILNDMSSKKLEKYTKLGIDKEFDKDTKDAAKIVDQEGKNYNDSLANYKKLWGSKVKQKAKKVTLDLKTKEMLDEVIKKQGGINSSVSKEILGNALNKLNSESKETVSLLKEEARQALIDLHEKKELLDIAKDRLSDALDDGCNEEKERLEIQFGDAKTEAEESYNKEKDLLHANYNSDLANLNKSCEDLSKINDNALENIKNVKEKIMGILGGNSGETSKNTISELNAAVSIGLNEIAKRESLLKKNLNKIDKLNIRHEKEIKSCDANHLKQVKNLSKQKDKTVKVLGEKYKKIYPFCRKAEQLEPVNNSV